MIRVESILFGAVLAASSVPALAGPASPAPAPIAGIGIGAAALIGLGYRALKSRFPHD